MVSVIASWGGTVATAEARAALSARVREVGALSHALLDDRPPVTTYDRRIEGRIVVTADVFGDGEGGLQEVSTLQLEGAAFRLADARNLYPDDCTISFAFAALPGAEDDPWPMVLVADKAACANYVDPAIRAADWLVSRPRIHLRYFAEGWLDRLLAYVKRFHAGDLTWWRHEEMSGWAQFAADERSEAETWDSVLAGFVAEVNEWGPKGLEARAWLDHVRATGQMPAAFYARPQKPLRVRLTLEGPLARLLSTAAHRRTLAQVIKARILKAGKGFDLFYLSFAYAGRTIAVSSKLRDDDELIIRASLTSDTSERAIAEHEARSARPGPRSRERD